MTALEELRELRRQKELRECTQPSPKSPESHGMTLAQFAVSGRVVVIYSDVLDCEVMFAADNVLLPETETRPVYRARELAGLDTWTPDGLRLLHEVKTRFGGEVMDENDSTT